MTKTGKTYGMGIGIQIGGYAEWYQRLRAAGRLVPDARPEVAQRQPAGRWSRSPTRWPDLFKQGIAPPLGTYTYDAAPAAFAAGKMAIYSSDLASTTVLPAIRAVQLEAPARTRPDRSRRSTSTTSAST